MGIWSAIINTAKNQTVRSVGKCLTYPLAHPQRTLQGMGTATKTAVIGGGMGYLAWEGIVNDKPVVQTASEMLVGEEVTAKAGEAISKTADGVGTVIERTGDAIEGAGNMLSGGEKTMSSMGNFFQGLFSGNGVGMIGDFFKNLGNGNVSGMGLAGLVGAALLCFGRFGWLGKIVGAILGMMVIGNNFNLNKVMGGDKQTASVGQERSSTTPQERIPANPQHALEAESNPTIHRSR